MRLLQTFAGHVITGAASAVVASLFVLAVVLFCQVADTGSAADWIASVANIAMAIITGLAFIVARSWLPQLMTQEGYKEAIRLVNEQYIQLGPGNAAGQSAESAMKAFREQNENNASASLEAYADALNHFRLCLQAGDAALQEIRETRFRLDTYGLTIHHVYAASIDNMVTAYEHALQSAWWLCEVLTKDASLRLQARNPHLSYNSLNWPAITLAVRKTDTAEGVEAQYQNVAEYMDAMVKSHQTVFSPHPPVGKLFCLRK